MAGEKSIAIELGTTGLPVSGGRVFDEANWKLTAWAWARAVRDMTANDPVINSFLFAIEMLARQATWKIVPFSEETEAERQADFYRGVFFRDMTQTWQETLSEILTFLPWGWSYLELCYKRRSGESSDKRIHSHYTDGKIGLRKISIRAHSIVRVP